MNEKNRKTIKVIGVIGKKNAMTIKDANILFNNLKKKIKKGKKIELCFADLQICTSVFISNSIGKLYGYFGLNLDKYLNFKNLNYNYWKEHIANVKTLYTNPEAMKLHINSLLYVLYELYENDTIKVIDVIGTPCASLHIFGERLFEVAKIRIESNQKVVLSFAGITALTSGFLNASIGNLYFLFSDKLKESLELKDVEPKWQEKIDNAITLALDKELSKFHKKTWDLATD